MAKKLNKIKILILFIFVILLVIIVLSVRDYSISKSDVENVSKINNINQNISTENKEENIIIVDITNKEESNNNNEIINDDPINEVIEEPVEVPSDDTTSEPNEDQSNEPIEEPTIDESENKENREFGSNVAFIGDSRTQAFLTYTGLRDVTDYTNIGLMVDTAVTKKFVTNSEGEKITILEDLQTKDIDTVYIMLGVNELGWVYSSIFIQKYEDLIDKIKEIKPNCEVIIQSIIPVTKTKSDNDDIYNNEKINEYNELIKQMAERKQIQYINLVPELADQSGNLPEDASPDGVHLNREYCLKWLECLKNN